MTKNMARALLAALYELSEDRFRDAQTKIAGLENPENRVSWADAQDALATIILAPE